MGTIQAMFLHEIKVGLAEGTLITVDTYDGEKIVQNNSLRVN